MEGNEESNEIFVSYRRADVDFTKRIYQELKKSGHSIWVDWEDIPPGVEGFSDEIQRGIESAVAVICILSPGYLESEYCLMELREAIRLKKRVIPVVCKKFEPLAPPEGIGHINWVYFTPHAGHENTFEEAFPRVLQAIESDYQHSREHTRLLLRSLDWQKNDRGHGYLLKDAELDKAEHWQVAAVEKNPAPTELQGEYILTSRAYQRQQQRRSMAVIGALLVFALAAAIFAGFQWKDAKEKEQDALEARDFAKAQEAYAISEKNRAEAAEGTALQAKEEAEQQREIAQIEAQNALISSLAAQSQLIRRRQLGILVALEAYYASEKKGNVSPAVQTSLRTALVDFGGVPVQSHQSDPMYVSFSPDGRWLISSTSDGQIQVSDLAASPHTKPVHLLDTNDNLKLVIQTNYYPNKPAGLLVSPDSRWLAGIFETDNEAGRREIHLWDLNDLASGSRPLNLPESDLSILTFAFGRLEIDRYQLAAGLDDGSLYMWNVGADLMQAEPVLFEPARNNRGTADQIAFSPDGNWLAVSFNFKYSDENSLLANPMMLIWNPKKLSGKPVLVNLIEIPVDKNLIFSGSGKWLAGASANKLRLWNMDTITTNPSAQSYDVAVTDVALSPDDQWVSVVGNQEAYVWNLSNFSRIKLPGYKDLVETTSFSPDSRWLATGDYDGQIRFWNTADLAKTDVPLTESQSRLYKGFDVVVWSLKFNADGTQMSAAGDQQVRVWNFLKPVADPIRTTYYQYIDPTTLDKNFLLIPTTDRDLVLVDLGGNEPVVAAPTTHKKPILSTFLSTDKRYLVINSGKQIEVRDLQNSAEQPIFRQEIQAGNFENPTFTADERWFVYTIYNQIFVVDLQKNDGNPVLLSGNRVVLSISEFFTIENWLISKSSGEIIAWNTKDGFGTPVRLSAVAESSVVLPLEDSPSWLFVQEPDSLSARNLADLSITKFVLEGEYFYQVIQDRWLLTTLSDGKYRLRDLSKPETVVVETITLYGLSNVPNWFYYFDDETMHMLDLSSGKAQSVPDKITSNSSLLFSPDDQWLAVSLASETPEEPVSTFLYELTNDWQEFKIPSGYSPESFSPNGQWLILRDAEGSISIYNMRVHEILSVTYPVGNPAFSMDERWLIVEDYTNGQLSFYNLETGVQVDVPTPTLSGYSQSEDGKWLVANLSRNNLTEAILVDLNDPQKFYLLTGHTDVTQGRYFTPDNRALLTYGYDGTIRIWDLHDPAADPVVLPHGEGRLIDNVRLSENGKWLLSISAQGSEVYIWQWDFGGVAELACRLVGRNLTLSEWTKYFGMPDEYRKTCDTWDLEKIEN